MGCLEKEPVPDRTGSSYQTLVQQAGIAKRVQKRTVFISLILLTLFSGKALLHLGNRMSWRPKSGTFLFTGGLKAEWRVELLPVCASVRALETVTLDHDVPFYFVWLPAISAAFLYNAIFVPLRASFCDFNRDHLNVWLTLDYVICDVIYLIDMFIKTRMRYYEQGIQVCDIGRLRKRYFRSREFFIDAISILPTDLIYIGNGFDYTSVRLNRMLRYSRLFETISRIESTVSYPNVFRLITTVLGTVVVLFYGSIFYHSYSKAVGFGDTDEDYPLSKVISEKPFLTRFMHCLYWSCMTFLFIGEMPVPKHPLERLIEIVAWLLGLTMFGVIVGRLAEILNNMNATEDGYNRQLQGIRGYLHFQKAPPEIYNKIVKWFGYASENNVLGSADKVLKPLPDKLKSEIAMDMHLAAMKKVQLFADLETPLLRELVTRFKLQVFSPQDYVCKKGDIGREMYVVREGSLEVVSDDGTKIFVTLGPGTVFGEISLLSIPGSRTGNRRTANVRSKGYATLFSLSKEALYAVLEDYPGAMQKLVEKGTDILRKEKKLDEDAVASKEAEERAFEAKYKKIMKAIDETEKTIAMLITCITHSHKSADKRLSYIEQQVALRTRSQSAPGRNNLDDDKSVPSTPYGYRSAPPTSLEGPIQPPFVETMTSKLLDVVPLSQEGANSQTSKAVSFSENVTTIDEPKAGKNNDTDDTNAWDDISDISSDVSELSSASEKAPAPGETTKVNISGDSEKQNKKEQEDLPVINVVPATPQSPTESEKSERGSTAATDDLTVDINVNNYFYDT